MGGAGGGIGAPAGGAIGGGGGVGASGGGGVGGVGGVGIVDGMPCSGFEGGTGGVGGVGGVGGAGGICVCGVGVGVCEYGSCANALPIASSAPAAIKARVSGVTAGNVLRMAGNSL